MLWAVRRKPILSLSSGMKERKLGEFYWDVVCFQLTQKHTHMQPIAPVGNIHTNTLTHSFVTDGPPTARLRYNFLLVTFVLYFLIALVSLYIIIPMQLNVTFLIRASVEAKQLWEAGVSNVFKLWWVWIPRHDKLEDSILFGLRMEERGDIDEKLTVSVFSPRTLWRKIGPMKIHVYHIMYM